MQLKSWTCAGGEGATGQELLQNGDNGRLLGTPVYCSLKLGGDAPPMLKLGEGAAARLPPLAVEEAALETKSTLRLLA